MTGLNAKAPQSRYRSPAPLAGSKNFVIARRSRGDQDRSQNSLIYISSPLIGGDVRRTEGVEYPQQNTKDLNQLKKYLY